MLLGIGLATLVSAKQNVIIAVGDVDGVRVGGLLLQAGPPGPSGEVAPALLQWGSTSGYTGDGRAPGIMHDLFVRVGGPDGTRATPVAAAAMVHVRSGHVIGDNLWLWRADHLAGGGVASYEGNRWLSPPSPPLPSFPSARPSRDHIDSHAPLPSVLLMGRPRGC